MISQLARRCTSEQRQPAKNINFYIYYIVTNKCVFYFCVTVLYGGNTITVQVIAYA